MEKECMNCGGSIYFQCRKEAAKYNDRLSSREGASEMLNVSVSSLSNYACDCGDHADRRMQAGICRERI